MPVPITCVFAVKVSVAGGRAAMAAKPMPAEGYRYNVKDFMGNTLGISMTPEKPRTPGADYWPGEGTGTGYNDVNGLFVLLDANERER